MVARVNSRLSGSKRPASFTVRELGLARKPMFTVPNHMLGQFSTELLSYLSFFFHPDIIFSHWLK